MAENDPTLAKLLARVAAWQAAVDSYKAARALEQGFADLDTEGPSRATPIELPVGAFRGMTITEAVKLYLQSVRRKQSVQEIADGLRAGGIESLSKDFGPTLRSILHQLKKRGELLRFKDGWDLAEGHSTALRNRMVKDASGKPKGRKKSTARATAKRKGAKTRKPRSTKPHKAPSGPKGPSLDERVVAFVKSKPMEWFTPQQIADGIKETGSLSLAFARLVRYGRIAKQADGRFAAPKS